MFTAKNIQILDSNNNNISPAVGLQSLYYEEEDGQRIYRRPIYNSVVLTDSSSYVVDSAAAPNFICDVSIEEKEKAGVKVKVARVVKHTLQGNVVDTSFLNSSLNIVNSSILEVKNSITTINSSLSTLNSSVNKIEGLNLLKFDSAEAVNPKFVVALDPVETNVMKIYDITKLGTGGSSPVVDLDPYVMLSGQKPMTGDLKTKGLVPTDEKQSIGTKELPYENGYIKNLNSEEISTNALTLAGTKYTELVSRNDLSTKLYAWPSPQTFEPTRNYKFYAAAEEENGGYNQTPLGINYSEIKASIVSDLKVSTQQISDSSSNSQYYILGSETSSSGDEKVFFKDSNIFMKKSGGIYYSSDARLKDKIKPITDEEVSSIIDSSVDIIYDYNWKSTDLPGCGFIAQELLKIIPEAVNVNNATGYYSVDYNLAISKVIGALLKKVKEQGKEIEKLKRHLNA